MAKVDVTLKLDDALVAKVNAAGGDLSTVVEAALSRHLECIASDRRWAEENALLVEALAGGAAETA